MELRRIQSLDSMRGISSLVVLFFHCVTCYVIFLNANFGVFQEEWLKWITYTPLKLFWAGNEAVLLFFLLSGFVLALPIVNGRNTPFGIYVIKRYFRIYVPYIIIMAISTVLAVIFMQYKQTDLGLSYIWDNRWNHEVEFKAIYSYILMLTYDLTNVNGVVWSLFHEMRISIFIPFIAFIIIRYNFIKSGLMIGSVVLAGYYGLGWLRFNVESAEVSRIVFDFQMTFYYSIFFIAGVYLAKYVYKIKLREQKWYVKLPIFLVSIFLVNSKFTYAFGITDMKEQYLVSLVGIIGLFIVVLHSSLAEKILGHKILQWFGDISYSLYLVQIPVIMLSVIFLSPYIGLIPSFTFAFFTTILVAYFSYKYIELPAIEWGKMFTRKIRRKA